MTVASDNYWGRDEVIPQDLLDRFQVWQGRFEIVTREPELDWANFHEQGLGLCLELRQYIHEDIRIFYAKPIEDPCFEPDGEGDCSEDYWEIMPNGEARVVEDEERQRLWQVNSPD